MNLDFTGLLDPQKNHSLKLLNSLHLNGVAFDASPTGTGKTYCAAWIAKNFNAPTVVICPKNVRKTWENILTNFGIKAKVIVNYEKLTRGNTEFYSYIDKEYNKSNKWWNSQGISVKFPNNSLIIMDESHKCKGTKSLNGEMMVALKNAGHKLLMLSATAATNVTEMKAFGFVTNLHNGYGFSAFCKNHGAEFNNFGMMVWDSAIEKCREGMLEIHDTLFNFVESASRMDRKDFGNIFPDNRIVADTFDLGSNTDKLKKVYEIMESELDNLNERAMNYSSHHFAIIMKARRQSELLKCPAMAEWVENMFDEGINPIVFVNFTDSLEAIEKRLDKTKFAGKIGKIVGGQSERERNRQIEMFQKDQTRIMLVTIQSGAASISLHDLNGNFPRNTLVNPSWSAINTLQSLGRAHRANGKTPVLQKFFFASGVTIEERMRDRVQARLNNLECLNDGDLSIEIKL